MTLTIDDIVTHYILSSHPKNKAIVDIKDKNTGELRYIKIRHRLSKIYAVSLVDPVTFEVWAETQAKSATTKIKPIVLHLDADMDTPVEFRDTSRLGFEWTFTWEGEKYRWVRESRMSNTLECKAVRKSGDICVAQYLPRMLKDEYFGIFSVLGYNMLRCKLTKSRELELIILMSLMTLLDKSNDGGWKRDLVSKGVQDTPTTVTHEDPKSLQKKHKKEQLNDQKLQLLFEKDMKRSQKQIQTDQRQFMSADNSPAHTPKTSPLPTPSTSSSNFIRSPRLSRQKSASAITSNDSDEEAKLAQLFENLKTAEFSKQVLKSSEVAVRQQLRSQNQFQLEPDYYNHQHSLPIGYVAQQQYDNPPSLRSIRWNPEPSSYYVSRSNSHRRLQDDERRSSASEYPQQHYYPHVNNRYSTSEYYMPSYYYS